MAAHAHSPTSGRARTGDSRRRVRWAMLLTGVFMVAEAAGGWLAGSLALIADAGHMLTDTAALGLAWFAFRLADKPADAQRTYGYQRFQVVAAFVNGLVLIAIVAWIAVEAVSRMLAPVEVMGGAMLAIAVVGLGVNIAAFSLLHGGDRANLNLRGAALHVLGDLLGSVAAIVAAVVILATGWTPIDPILSLVVAGLVLRSAWYLVRRSGHILLEGTPDHLDPERLKAALTENVAEVEDIHHVHVWSLTPERPLVTLHANVGDAADHASVLAEIKRVLAERFGIDHSTVQIEPAGCADEHETGPAAKAPDDTPQRAPQG